MITKNKSLYSIPLVLQLLFVSLATNANEKEGFFNDSQRGWYYHETAAIPEEAKEPEQQQPQASPQPQEALSARELLKKQGEDWENAMAEAIMNPSPENYRNYLAKTAQITEQSQSFATGFKQTVWTTPEYDYTLQAPRDTQAIVANSQQRTEENDKVLEGLSEDNGLIFFFRGDCPFCHRFAPILSKFAERYGFKVIGVSLDGGTLPEYPYPKENYHLGARLKVENVPAVFMVNPEKNTVATVGYGYADWSKLTAKVLFAGNAINGDVQATGRIK